MKKVWIIHPASAWGGAERTTLIVLKSLKDLGIEPILVTNYPVFAREAGKQKTEVLLLPLQSWFISPHKVIKDIITLKRFLTVKEVCLLVGVMPYGAFLATLLSKCSGYRNIRSVVSPRGSCRFYLRYFVSSSWTKLVYKFLFSVAFGLADFFFSPSRLSTQDYIRFFRVNPRKCFYIPNGIYLPSIHLSDLTNRKIKSLAKPNLVWVGRLSGEKNLEFILNAFSMLKKKAFLYIVGDGPESQTLHANIEKMGLRNSVGLLGYVKNVFPIMNKAHIYLHSCLFEEFGYSIVEAMSVGLPVVACDCPYGPREILDYGRFGFLVRDEKDMAFIIDELLVSRDLWLEFSLRSFERARRYDIVKVLEIYKSMFRYILDE